jgi:DNA-binding protein HU-beta
MTKSETIEKLAEIMSIDKKQAEAALNGVANLVQGELKAGEKVTLPGLGAFSVVDTKARVARNPKTGESIQVPAKKKAKFKVGKELKDMVEAS